MRYQIQLDAPASDQVLAAFPELTPISSNTASAQAGTVLVGDLTDQSHLHSIIARIQTLGLGLAGLHRLPD